MVNVFTLLYRYLALHCIVNKRENLLQQYTRLYYALHKHNSRTQTIKTKKVTRTRVFENDRCCKDTTYIASVCFVCFQMFFGMFRQSCVEMAIHLPTNFCMYTKCCLYPASSSLQLVLASGPSQLDFSQIFGPLQHQDRCPMSMLQQLQQRLLADLAFASAAAGTYCIPDDGLDELMVAAGEIGELMMTCEMELMDSAECTKSHGHLALTCSSHGCVPEDSVLYYVAGYIAFKLKQFTHHSHCA